jgi:hypothetical protein
MVIEDSDKHLGPLNLFYGPTSAPLFIM